MILVGDVLEQLATLYAISVLVWWAKTGGQF